MILLIILTILFSVLYGILVSSGFSMYLMTQSLESYNLDKINGPSKVISHTSMYSKTILPTQDTGVPNLTIPPTGVTMVFLF